MKMKSKNLQLTRGCKVGDNQKYNDKQNYK